MIDGRKDRRVEARGNGDKRKRGKSKQIGGLEERKAGRSDRRADGRKRGGNDALQRLHSLKLTLAFVVSHPIVLWRGNV